MMSDLPESTTTQFTPARPKLWRWILGTLIILFSWLVIGGILYSIVASVFDLDLQILDGADEADREILRSYQPWQAASPLLVSFLPLLFVPLLLHRYLLKLPLRSIFTRSNQSFSREVRIGASVMTLILIVATLLDFLFFKTSYTWSFDAARFLPYLLVALILIPIQTTAEEVFYRGWIQQRLENGRRSIWLVSFVCGLLFALPHMSNPEVNGEFILPIIGYGSMGFMFTWVTIRNKSMGLAIGAHAMNNIWVGLLVSSTDSALTSASLLVTSEIEWVSEAAGSVLIVPLFIWLTGKWKGKVTP